MNHRCPNGDFRLTLSDALGEDWLNMAAMTSDLTVGLLSDGTGGASAAGIGAFIQIASGTTIENVVTGDGDDTLRGNNADNELHAMRGNDTLDGGLGDDDLWGGTGNDFFVFYAGDGQDWIGDFTAGLGTDDVIALNGFGALDFAGLSLSDLGDDVQIDLGGGDEIVLAGLSSTDLLHEDDFLFFTT